MTTFFFPFPPSYHISPLGAQASIYSLLIIFIFLFTYTTGFYEFYCQLFSVPIILPQSSTSFQLHCQLSSSPTALPQASTYFKISVNFFPVPPSTIQLSMTSTIKLRFTEFCINGCILPVGEGGYCKVLEGNKL